MSTRKIQKPLFAEACRAAFLKLDPRILFRNPVICITAVGAALTTGLLFAGQYSAFTVQIALWLWFTVLFANFSEALAEGRGRAQAESLRRFKSETGNCAGCSRKIFAKTFGCIKPGTNRRAALCQLGHRMQY